MSHRAYRFGIIGAVLIMAGIVLSGPLALLATRTIAPQPTWTSPEVFAENYHPIQIVTFYLGFLIILGSLFMSASIYLLAADREWPLMGLLFTLIASTLIFFNYTTQITLMPALAQDYVPEYGPIITALSMYSSTSLAWTIEMWGYGFLGVGTWCAAAFFADAGIERTAKLLFVANGVTSVLAALWTAFDLAWVPTTAGLISFAVWNALYFALALVFLLALRSRRARMAAIV